MADLHTDEPTQPADLQHDSSELASTIAFRLQGTPVTISVAESLTSGSISCHLGAAEDASEWFRGGVVAYSAETKFTVLGVDPGPVVTASCARQMADGVAQLTGSDLAVSVTGVGGPDPEEGLPAGTVYFGVHTPRRTMVHRQQFAGDPNYVVRATTFHALQLLAAEVPAKP